ncbi:hypothetical protein EV356DRAFT_535170 [Viridothelium virens]|uniref:Nephrocystin 3-like N-terminal domain-containing protein n=1 Tax=Viridothelium virens TaxID=1048519 RepID=A0A6A6H1C8_VIRVR|nr:hypothetical protein EV356DRAFT_535170 [Viridothelium virens]
MASASRAEISRHGFSTVYTPPSRVGRAVAHIIFIHGLFGHPEMTWTTQKPLTNSMSRSQHSTIPPTNNSPANENLPQTEGTGSMSKTIFWPAEMLPAVIPNVNVHTWGYDADIDGFLSSASQNTVAQHAANMLSDLADLLENDESKPLPVFFIVHSLGGVVLKAAMNQSAETKATRLRTVVDHVLGIVFLGTPHRGSKTASIGRYAHKKIQIYSFREEKQTRRFVILNTVVVEPDSAKIGLPEEEVSTIPESHGDMTKFRSPSDIGFKRIVAQLKRWVKLIEVEDTVTVDGDCLQSLQSTDTQLRFNTVASSHVKTFHWLHDSNKVSFSKWLQDSENMGSIYWIQGKPGSGKSTLMKFAMQDHRTRHALGISDGSPYIIAGYFFHDRGKLIQKSIQGMLQALLFSVLSQSFELRQFVQPVYTILVSHQHTKSVAWDFDALQDAFQAVVQQRQVKIRLCLFLDALDEHHGDNDRLSGMMHNLATLSDGQIVNIRLCLTSRPWDTFVSNFGRCPRFKIHEHTREDIEAYTSSQLHKALDKLPDYGPAANAKSRQLDIIANQTSNQAQGVFIWVRIVVELIAAAIRDRTPFVALESMLAEMPSELEDLYSHTLARIDSRHVKESYVMLQIARCSLIPLGLESFANTTSWALWKRVPDPGDETLEDMTQRVISRSGGLLEVIEFPSTPPLVETYSDDDEISVDSLRYPEDQLPIPPLQQMKSRIVQFCHQTAKEYIQKLKGDFGLQLSGKVGNGYQYMMAAAVSSPRGWAKHMADEILEYAILSRKADPATSSDYILKKLWKLHPQAFPSRERNNWLFRKKLHFYVQMLYSQSSQWFCLAFAAGLLDILTGIPIQIGPVCSDLWLTALLGPPVTSKRVSRRDMLQSLWDAVAPSSASKLEIGIWLPDRRHVSFTPLEVMVIDKVFKLSDGVDRTATFQFLLSHGADPNMKCSQDLMNSLRWRYEDSDHEHPSFTVFMACIRQESAPVIRLFGRYGARVPKVYCEPLRRMWRLIKAPSEVFFEVMRIVESEEPEPLETHEADVIDDCPFGLILPSMVGVATVNGRMLLGAYGENAALALESVVLAVVLFKRWRRRAGERRKYGT